ncbi:MAG: hypothetical protein Q9219_002377 [cf. Caloplaca sp. 3 TL-2023]
MEDLVSSLNSSIQCREPQIQQLISLLASDFPSPPNLVLHGREATGKTLTVTTLLKNIDHPSAIIPCRECITTRHLLERTLTEVQDKLGAASNCKPIDGRCESISAFVVQLHRLLSDHQPKKFILVFDNIDRQREPSPTLLPALARLGETIPHLTTLFILTLPRPHLFHKPGILHLHFPPYTRAQLLSLITTSPPSTPPLSPSDLSFLYPRFAAAVHDALAQPTSNSLPHLTLLLQRLWPPFVAPVLKNEYTAREPSKLMVRSRYLFQSEDALKENIIHLPSSTPSLPNPPKQQQPHPEGLLQLPRLPAQLLLAAYLTSHNPPKNDTLLFSKYSASSRRKRRAHKTPRKNTAATAHRKLSRQMLGPQPFALERLLAVHAALFLYNYNDDEVENGYGEGRTGKKGGGGGGAEILTQFATLVGMRLVVRSGGSGGGGGGGGGDPFEAAGGKWKVNVGIGYVRQVARGLRFDVDDYLLE